MIDSVLTETLKSLSSEEITSFGKFVRSPYFNESPALTSLFDILRKNYPAFTNRNLTKEKIYRKIYPQKKYNDDTMRKLISELLRLAEDFLSYSELDKKYAFEKKVYLLNSLRSRNLDRRFTRGLKTLHEEFKPLKNVGDDYFYRNLDLTKLELGHIIGRGMAGKYDIYDELRGNFDERSRYLIYYSLIQIYKSAQDLLALSQRYNFNFGETLIYKFLSRFKAAEFMDELAGADPSMYPVIAIYFLNFTIYSGADKDDSKYYILKELVLRYKSAFTLFEKNNLMVFLENCCLEKIKEGKKEFQTEIHEIYKIILSESLYMFREGDSMDTGRFMRIFNNAILLKKYEWAEEFIQTYNTKLSDELREDVVGYSLAVLNFSRSEYDKAIKHASKVKFTSYILKFQTQIVQLKSYYERGYLEEILYMVDSYKRTLKTDTTAPKDAREKFNNFLQLLGKMVKVKFSDEQGKSGAAGEIAKELKPANVYDKLWLEEKISSLT